MYIYIQHTVKYEPQIADVSDVTFSKENVTSLTSAIIKTWLVLLKISDTNK